MKTPKFTFILLIVLTAIKLSAQTNKKNSVYVEILGNGVIYSINYDRIISISNQLKLSPRIGFEFLPRGKDVLNTYNNKYGNWSFPLEMNLLWSKQATSTNFAEAGLGLTLFSMIKGYELNQANEITDTEYQMAKITMLRLGYRHQKPDGGLMYRAGIMARLTQDKFSRTRVGDDLFYILWPGFSIGYTF